MMSWDAMTDSGTIIIDTDSQATISDEDADKIINDIFKSIEWMVTTTGETSSGDMMEPLPTQSWDMMTWDMTTPVSGETTTE